ncbi:MAG: hypothetical protein EXS69_01210 [Candidatus Zambryskibacteria bacterium]|nr:hypothetical protein [Candidatus Zambryskibacteria bacterium]
MPKNIDDVISPERKRSIRNIPIPEGRRKTGKVVSLDTVKRPARMSIESKESREEYSSVVPLHKIETYRRRRSARRNIWLAGGVAALILFFAILSFFDGGTLAYIPKSAALTFDNDVYSAAKTGEEKLLYSVVKLSGEKGVTVPVNGEEQVSRKASGTIVIYNDVSSESQRLIENTRFESPSGKIYRIASAITIPGKKNSQPGSIEAVVYADIPGDSHNTGLTDFTVPGLKGTAHYSTIYARSKTTMSGGLVGMEKKVGEENLVKAKGELKTALNDELLSRAQAEVPSDFILFPNLSSVTFEDMPQSDLGNDSATINMKGNLFGIMFKRTDLAVALAQKKLDTILSELVDFVSFDTLELAFTGTPPIDPLSLNEISFKVSGTGTVLWRTDEVALRSDLVGRNKRDIPVILKNYPAVVSTNATLRPFWKTTFPDNGDKISIKKLKVE